MIKKLIISSKYTYTYISMWSAVSIEADCPLKNVSYFIRSSYITVILAVSVKVVGTSKTCGYFISIRQCTSASFANTYG